MTAAPFRGFLVTQNALPAAALPLYPGLGQAPNMLACIASGVALCDFDMQRLRRTLTYLFNAKIE